MRNHHRRGVTLAFIVILMGLVAAAVGTLTTLFAAQLQRTSDALAQPQIRQLLLAAAPLSRHELETAGPADRTVSPGVPVPGATLTLRFHANGQSAVVDVIATFRNERTTQELQFTRGADTWILTNARIAAMPLR